VKPLFVAAIALAVFWAPALAVTPDEMLTDPVLEARARTLGRELRCLVCQNQSVDDSNSGLARDLRILLRERIVAGDKDDDAIAYIALRYGDYVLLRPPVKAETALLWAGPALFLFGASAVFLRLFRRPAPALMPLTAAERKKLVAQQEKREAT
jgi:cytochrome c-type biogenesis protein CcmH